MKKWVTDKDSKGYYWPSEEAKSYAWVKDEKIYEEAAKDPIAFWDKKAREGISWFKPWKKTYLWKPPYYKWFIGGKLNVCYNCVDRHVESGKGKKPAIIWIPEPMNEEKKVLTFEELHKEVQKFANVLKELGVKKGDRVTIYLPMIPEAQIAMLACARIGAIHSVVFSAFSPESLRARIDDAKSKVLITSDGYYRRGKIVELKKNADEAVSGKSPIKKVIVVKRAGNQVEMKKKRDFWWHELMAKAKEKCAPAKLDSEQPLFILYTSGTTGKPKGVIHVNGGYIVMAYWTSKYVFDLHDEDIFWCTADIGWVTGHTYNCYGILATGSTLLFYEGTPDFPDKDRWWKIVEENKVTIFYTAPTAIRMCAQWGSEWPAKHDLSSLRLLGTVGEPIDQQAWSWYFENIGGSRCPIVDTWWQTETGATLITTLPGVGPFIPTVAGRTFPGVTADIVDAEKNSVSGDMGGYLVLKSPFPPSLLRGLWKAEKKYIETYWLSYDKEFYSTNDGARRVDNKYIRITGRVDDVMNVSGHRISTAEIENAIASHKNVAECAVVSQPHPIKGEAPFAFVVLKEAQPSEQLKNELFETVRVKIGPIAKPEVIAFADALPKTRSGKIMRRMLRALVTNQPIGDTTTLLNPESIEQLKKVVGYKG
ncbi:MAG: acetate--CoA ligase [Candidatus Diapherotrites archaeon]|nr:acetate--CoA ligase [Candidatus Diapherotrites archaeon]